MRNLFIYCLLSVMLAAWLLCGLFNPALAQAIGRLDRSQTVTWVDAQPITHNY